MPELPEVETVRQTLLHQIKNEKIKDIKIIYRGILENTTESDFCTKLTNQSIKDILRYGKYLIFVFDNVSLVTHLRMEGKFFIKSSTDEIEKHEHVIFKFYSGKELRYHDTRKFGKMVLLDTTDFVEIMNYPALAKLGPEANVCSDVEYFYNKINKLKTPIKTVLLDQTILCGIGNIYADEICYLSKINPLTLACNLNVEDATNILKYANSVLKEAILCGGTTIRSYTSSLGVTGRFQQQLLVHSREGENCKTCNKTIKKIFVGGRGTYFCEDCQENKNITIVGLTGNIASGKSTVVEYLKKLNFEIIDTDVISRRLTKDKTSDLKKIMNQLKKFDSAKVEMIYQNECLDRNKFRMLLFEDETFKNNYHSIIHPIIKKEVLKGIKTSKNDIIKDNKKRILFLDVPLLYEASFDELCDNVLIINAEEEVIYQRIRKRNNLSDSDIAAILRNQLSFDEKIKRAKFNLDNINQAFDVIDNSTDLDSLYLKIDEYLHKLNK